MIVLLIWKGAYALHVLGNLILTRSFLILIWCGPFWNLQIYDRATKYLFICSKPAGHERMPVLFPFSVNGEMRIFESPPKIIMLFVTWGVFCYSPLPSFTLFRFASFLLLFFFVSLSFSWRWSWHHVTSPSTKHPLDTRIPADWIRTHSLFLCATASSILSTQVVKFV